MSDRREAVAKAIKAVPPIGSYEEWVDDVADATIAAYEQAEPTEADYYAQIVDDVIEALMFSQHIEREALEEVKVFLLTARTARKEAV